MNEQIDARIGDLLRTDAPPERDALFRIGLLERRERQRYRSRTRTLLIGATLLGLLGLGLAHVHNPFAATLITAFCLVLVGAGLRSARGVLQALRWLRGA
jgi:hypothetical protein